VVSLPALLYFPADIITSTLPLLLRRNRSVKQSDDASLGWGRAPTTRSSPSPRSPLAGYATAPPAAPLWQLIQPRSSKAAVGGAAKWTFWHEHGTDCSVLHCPSVGSCLRSAPTR